MINMAPPNQARSPETQQRIDERKTRLIRQSQDQLPGVAEQILEIDNSANNTNFYFADPLPGDEENYLSWLQQQEMDEAVEQGMTTIGGDGIQYAQGFDASNSVLGAQNINTMPQNEIQYSPVYAQRVDDTMYRQYMTNPYNNYGIYSNPYGMYDPRFNQMQPQQGMIYTDPGYNNQYGYNPAQQQMFVQQPQQNLPWQATQQYVQQQYQQYQQPPQVQQYIQIQLPVQPVSGIVTPFLQPIPVFNINRYDYAFEEDYIEAVNEYEKQVKKICDTNVYFTKKFTEWYNDEYEEDEVETSLDERMALIDKMYGYKSQAQLQTESAENKQKAIDATTNRNNKSEEADSEPSMISYNKNGDMVVRTTVRIGVEDENGYHEMNTPPVNPETGYQEIIHRRHDMEVAAFNEAHAYDYIRQEEMTRDAYSRALSQYYSKWKAKLPDSLSYEEGAKKLGEIYEEEFITSRENQRKLIEMIYPRVKRLYQNRNYMNTFSNSGVDLNDGYLSIDENGNIGFTGDDVISDEIRMIHEINKNRSPEQRELDARLEGSLRKDYNGKKDFFISNVVNGVKTRVGTTGAMRDFIGVENPRSQKSTEELISDHIRSQLIQKQIELGTDPFEEMDAIQAQCARRTQQ